MTMIFMGNCVRCSKPEAECICTEEQKQKDSVLAGLDDEFKKLESDLLNVEPSRKRERMELLGPLPKEHPREQILREAMGSLEQAGQSCPSQLWPGLTGQAQ